MESLDRRTELTHIRIASAEAAFVFTITFSVGDTPMRLQPIDTVVFDDNGAITCLRSYFAASDMIAG